MNIRQLITALIVLLSGFLTQAAGAAALKCPRVFGGNMVLQRRKPVPIWGWAEPGATVTVSFGGQEKTGTAGPDGRWSVKLDAMEANAKGQTLIVRAGNEKIEMTDVLVGEVWLASGQSNMAWVLSSTSMPKDIMDTLNRPNIRILAVNEVTSLKPLNDLAGKWLVLNAKSTRRVSGVAAYFAMYLQDQLQIPIGILDSSRGGTKIETWTPAEGFDLVPELKTQADEVRALQAEADKRKGHPKSTPGFNYNAMIHPMVGTALRGAIWYQGESNTGDGLIYEKKMQALVGGWRALWKQPPSPGSGVPRGEFPFYFVQLAPWHQHRAPNLGLLWEAQLRASRSIPNSGMVVTTDIGNIKDVHPRNKNDVGKRLALWALAKDYPETRLKSALGNCKAGDKAAKLVYSGPLYTGYKIKDKKVIISFDHAESGLAFKGDALRDITIKGEGDKKFVPAVAAIDGSTLVVSHPEGKTPLHVRMGWERAAQPNLMNKEGLPASPFRTDM